MPWGQHSVHTVSTGSHRDAEESPSNHHEVSHVVVSQVCLEKFLTSTSTAHSAQH